MKTQIELENLIEEIFDKHTKPTGGGYEADYTDKTSFINELMEHLVSLSTPLKQLSEITDEHLLEMVNICLVNIYGVASELTKIEFVREGEDFGVIAYDEQERIGFTVEDTGKTGIQFQLSIDDLKNMHVNIPQLIQYLQFKGYDVPHYYPVSEPKQLSDEEIENMAEEKLGFNSSQEYYKKWMEGAKCVRDLLSVSLLKEEKTVPKLSFDDMYDSDGIMKPEYAKAVRDTLSLSPQSDHINPIELLEWVSVKERLPEYGSYLCSKSNDWIKVCYVNVEHDTNKFQGWSEEETDKVVHPTHWMPLPAPPKI